MTTSWKSKGFLGGVVAKKAENSSFLIFKVSGQYHPPDLKNTGFLPVFFYLSFSAFPGFFLTFLQKSR